VILAGEDLGDAADDLPRDLDDVLGGGRGQRNEGDAAVVGAGEDAVAKQRVEMELSETNPLNL
jgi:hypothetical protein